MNYIKFTKVKNNSKLPVKKTIDSAGYDCFADETITIYREPRLVPLGFKIEDTNIKYAHLELFIRSSLALKGLQLTNSVGIIDLDYRDEIKAIVNNICDKPIIINKGDRIAQLILKSNIPIDSLTTNDYIRVGGFGSTGEN